jgi:prepilin-type N-terminal cleavage/methylation domain-containing protein
VIWSFGFIIAIPSGIAVAPGNDGTKMQLLLTRPTPCSTAQKRKQTKMKTIKNIRKSGFTLVEIMIVVAIIGLLAAIAIPNFVKARATSQANACINNLRQIDAAANQFALEAKLSTGATITFPSDLTPYIKLNSNSKIPGCPASGTYSDGLVGTNPTCSKGSTVTPAHILP